MSVRAMARIAWPIALANLTAPLVGLVDAAVVARTGDAAAIAAVSMGAAIFASLFLSFGFLRMGVTSIVARRLGADDPRGAEAGLLSGLIAAVILGGALIALSAPFKAAVLAVYEADPLVEALAGAYADVRMWGAPFVFVNYAILGALVAAGRTGAALAHQGVLHGVNMTADIILVLGFDLGVAGAAWGGVAADMLAAPVGLVLLARMTTLRLPITRDHVARACAPATLQEFFRLNGDIFLRTLALLGALFFFNRQAATFGAGVQASLQIAIVFVNLAAGALDGVAFAAEGFAGRAAGAKDAARFARIAVRSSLLALGLACGISLLFAIGLNPAVAVLIDDPGVVAAFAAHRPWLILAPIAAVAAYQFDGLFLGAGRSRPMRDVTAVSAGAFAIIAAGAPQAFGPDGLWLALMALYAVRGAGLAFAWPGLMRGLKAA